MKRERYYEGETFPQVSPRNQIPFRRVPTKKGSIYGGSCVVHYPEEYGPILDSVLEMTRDVAEANGIPYTEAIKQVLKDEGWTVLPTHQREILRRLS